MTSRQARLFAFSPLIAGLAAWLAGYLNAPQTRSAELSFDGTRAFADLEALVDTFGPRPTSLPKCERQAEWIRDRFREAGLEARVDHGEIDRLPLWNAVATLPGSGDRFIVVLGHHDTVSNAPGAEDNGSAVAALIELGRSLKGRSLRHTVLLCATDSEENGGQGAELLVKSLGPEGISRTDACIGLEMLGWEGGIPVLHALPRNFAAVVEGYVPAPLPAAIVNAAPESLAFADPYFSPIVQSLSRYARVPSGSDDIIFFRVGVPSVLLARSSLIRFYPHYHSPQDTPDKLSPAALQSSGRILEAAVFAADALDNPREGPTEYLLLHGAVMDRRLLAALSAATALSLLGFARRTRRGGRELVEIPGPARDWKTPLGACLVALPLLLTTFRFSPLVLVAVWPVGAFFMIVSSVRNRFVRIPLFWIPLVVVIAVPMVFWAARRSFGVQLPATETWLLTGSALLATVGYALARAGAPPGTPA